MDEGRVNDAYHLADFNNPRDIAGLSVKATTFLRLGGVLEVVSDPDAIARILHGARAPPAPPPPGQLLLLP